MKNLEKVSEILQKVSTFSVVALVVITFFQVAARYLLTPFEVFAPVVQFLNPMLLQDLEWHIFSVIFLTGMAMTLREDGHVRVDIFYQNFSEKKKVVVNRLGYVFFLLSLSIWILWTVMPEVIDAFQTGEGSANPGGISLFWPIQAMVVVACGSLILEGGLQLIKREK